MPVETKCPKDFEDHLRHLAEDFHANNPRPKKPVARRGATSDELRVIADQLDAYAGDNDVYKTALDQFRDEQKKVYAEFKAWALDETGLTDLSNADDVYQYAWDHGHSSGLHEVYCYLDDLARLFAPHIK